MEGHRVHLAPVGGHGQERLDLRREVERARRLEVVDRLLAGGVADEEALAPGVVPERDGEHAPERVREGRAVLLVEVRDQLGVGRRAEVVALRQELRPELGQVVELAVLGRPHGARLVGEGLAAVVDPDDGEATGPEGEPEARDEELVVRSPVGQAAQHDLNGRRVRHAEDAGDPAHRRGALSAPGRPRSSGGGPRAPRPAGRSSPRRRAAQEPQAHHVHPSPLDDAIPAQEPLPDEARPGERGGGPGVRGEHVRPELLEVQRAEGHAGEDPQGVRAAPAAPGRSAAR